MLVLKSATVGFTSALLAGQSSARHRTGDICSTVQQLAECEGVAHRLPCPSLLKYTKTSLPAASHSCSRSAHHCRSSIGVGTGVQAVRVWAVQADVHGRRGCSKHTREVRATRDAIRDRVVLEHREHMFIGPARMAKLDRGLDPLR